MIQLYTKKYFFPILIVFFFCDVFSFALFHEPLIFFVLCAYIITCFNRSNRAHTILALVMLSLESTIFYTWFGLDLLYAIPAYYCAQVMQAVLYRSSVQPYILVTACLIARFYGLDLLLFKALPPLGYTVTALFANIVVMWIARTLLMPSTDLKSSF